ncbi:hypothetical protein PLICRDRAFT_58629 [Plicaturopsis crispa FD-325 SS-3]|uniref:Unplaced genomic scaffold PLICRscaffold_105, whole genome shotgun sequence n=1 Tax=Plicaturopsis crispa FD-325 SS-3 TaxID=944288 RepID=A0A0C9T3Y6_PLICR|nr:hypothetical protein PLICRDRAFT_58629 [Plicaturopsis crispa FD-325 SS-3]
MMEELQWKLLELDIPFSAEGNRVRCFPHVINLAVKAGIDAHTKVTVPPPMPPSSVPPPSVPPSSVPPPSTGPAAPTNGASARQYAQALANNPIASCRSLVAQCRASGQRREDFASCIKEGNESGAFKLSVWQLLRDVDTRWSSTFFMMNRVLDLYPAIDAYLSKTKQSAIAHYKLTAVQLEVLEDICIFLAIPHSVQELLSGQKTPTLSAVLPAYEELLEMLKLFRVQTPRLAHMADAAIAKIEEYVARSRKTKIYALAMSTGGSREYVQSCAFVLSRLLVFF